MYTTRILLSFLLALLSPRALSQPTILDSFDSADGWKIITAEGVTLEVHDDEGVNGHALRLDYNFVTGAGYCIIQKAIPLKLPDNYEFTFQLKGEGPANNLEFKLLDPTGDNVWWHNRRALDWPRQWKRMVDKKRTIEFAWGPSNAPLKEVAKIEFAISSSSGGKGSIWLDELTFRELPPDSHLPLNPTTASSAQVANTYSDKNVLDGDPNTVWRAATGRTNKPIILAFDFHAVREFGGLEVDWENAQAIGMLSLVTSDDGTSWTPLGTPVQPRASTTIVPTPDAEARYLRLLINAQPGAQLIGVREVRIKGPEFSTSPNALFAALAGESPRGRYPRAFLNQQSYWTVIGADGDDNEALINEEGAVELCKRGPTLEPFIELDGKLLTWADADHTQSLERDYLPIPTVSGRYKPAPLDLAITAFADGDAGASLLWITYKLKNRAPADGQPLKGRLHIALRPFQVNPPWQKLNNEGGFAPITAIEASSQSGAPLLRFNGAQVQSLQPGLAAVASFEDGDVVSWLANSRKLEQTKLDDSEGRVSGGFSFDFDLAPAAEQDFTLVYPMHDQSVVPRPATAETVVARREACIAGWDEKLSRATIAVPKQDQWIADTFKSQLAYILINRDGPAIQPGSRSYERSWARDGSMTSAALLACGHADEVKAWIDWFGAHQFDSGKIPCVVDGRGPDPTPEHDSTGEYIWAVANYCRTTHDEDVLKRHWPRVQRAVAYIESLRAQRMTAEYSDPASPEHAFYGLVPESISHEGYSAKPMHSYWDDFFTLLGLKEAAWLADRVARQSAAGSDSSAAAHTAAEYQALAADFRRTLYDSIRAAMAANKINFIPGCVELADFDSTSTTIALFPCDEDDNLPQPALKNTFDRYWDYFKARGSPLSAWDASTPYELRHVGAFVRLGQPDRAYQALTWFHQSQRPQGWNHWAEVVWHDPLTPKFIGDMPHTWVGSDFLNSVLSMFVYEHNGTLITFAGIPRQWIQSGEEIAFSNIVTSRGNLSGSLQLQNNQVLVKLRANGPWEQGPITIRKPQGARGQDAESKTLPAQFAFEYAP